MDPISTGLGGALLARALPAAAGEANPSRLWTTTTLTVTVASVLPDIDIFFQIFSAEEMAGFTSHRAFTHSYLGAVVMAPLVALAVGRIRRDLGFARLTLLALLGFLWHIFTDLCTSWGTIVYWPFSRERVVWDILFIIDFTFTAVLLFPHLLAWIYREPARAWRRGLRVEAQAAIPQPLSPFRWSALVRTPEGIYQGWVNALDGRAVELEFFPSARNGFVEQAAAAPATEIYLWFARFPVAAYREDAGRHIIEYTDLRFRSPYRQNPFVFRVVLTPQGQAVTWGFR